jgi:hypothetical protein
MGAGYGGINGRSITYQESNLLSRLNELLDIVTRSCPAAAASSDQRELDAVCDRLADIREQIMQAPIASA